MARAGGWSGDSLLTCKAGGTDRGAPASLCPQVPGGTRNGRHFLLSGWGGERLKLAPEHQRLLRIQAESNVGAWPFVHQESARR